MCFVDQAAPMPLILARHTWHNHVILSLVTRLQNHESSVDTCSIACVTSFCPMQPNYAALSSWRVEDVEASYRRPLSLIRLFPKSPVFILWHAGCCWTSRTCSSTNHPTQWQISDGRLIDLQCTRDANKPMAPESIHVTRADLRFPASK